MFSHVFLARGLSKFCLFKEPSLGFTNFLHWFSASLISALISVIFCHPVDSCCSFSWVIFKYSDWLFSCAKNSNTTLDPRRSSVLPKHCHRNHSFHLICTPALRGRQYHYLSSHTLVCRNKVLWLFPCGLANLCHNHYWCEKFCSSNPTMSAIFSLLKMFCKISLNVQGHTIVTTSSLHASLVFQL